MKAIFLAILSIMLFIFGVVVVKTLTHPFATLSPTTESPTSIPISEEAVRRFAQGLSIPTISYIDSTDNPFAVYDTFRAYLHRAYPRPFGQLEERVINGHQLLLHWKGKNSSLPPILFMSHYDVVHPGPHEDDDDDHVGQNVFDFHDEELSLPQSEFTSWEYPPFGGAVANGRIYGRGALDMKNVVFSLLESIDTLLALGFTPERDVYVAFDPDEEVGGLRGAAYLAEYFKQQGIRFEAIYDEGGIIAAPGTAKGIDQNLALIGVAEKGVVGYRIKVKGTGGHSSMPPLNTAGGSAAIIMNRLETNQFKQRIIGPLQDFLNVAGAGMGFAGKMAIANQWLFEGLLLKQLARVPQTNALTRTTTAITMLKGSEGNNVLPQHVEVVINFRILPGETARDVLAHIEKACEGFDVEIDAPRRPVDPSPLSPTSGRAYDLLTRSINRLYPSTLITPYLTIGATDCKHMTELSDRIYRFIPILLSPFEQRTIHNFNEYISIENYSRMISHYTFLIENYDKTE